MAHCQWPARVGEIIAIRSLEDLVLRMRNQHRYIAVSFIEELRQLHGVRSALYRLSRSKLYQYRRELEAIITQGEDDGAG